MTYLSLGDSLAVGVGASDPATRGYAPLYRAALQRETGREVRLTQLGVSGETTESFVGSYPDPNASQLARAEAVLREHPTTRMTLSLGANDLLRTAERDDAARREALRRYGENLDSILTHLADASGPDARITVLALYNPAPGTFTDRWAGELNAVIRETAGRHGAAVAAGDDAFRGREADYARFIRSGNIHPTDEGYAALARAFAEAMPRARTPD